MVGVICLNCTNRKQVKRVLPKFFAKWPTSDQLLQATKEEIKQVIETLGMKNIRAERLYRMSEQFEHWDGEDAADLYGIGKYGSDSYRLFYKQEIPEDVGDHELKRYIQEELKA
jgi:methyl-CpG-binding domain protein 4